MHPPAGLEVLLGLVEPLLHRAGFSTQMIVVFFFKGWGGEGSEGSEDFVRTFDLKIFRSYFLKVFSGVCFFFGGGWY